jgi:deoxyadenosine/deoxycytidine kinase
MTEPLRISVAGNIASGKSTLMRSLSAVGEYCMLEGISDWGDLLKLSYSDPLRYTIPFQLRIVYEQTVQQKKIRTLNVPRVFTERSSEDGRHVFMEAKKAEGYIDDIQIKEFERWFELEWMGLHPHRVVYLCTPPDVCFQRKNERKQAGDDGVSKELLDLLHGLYEKLYGKYSDRVLVLEPAPVEDQIKKIFEWLDC